VEQRLIVEGEMTVELGPEGRRVRETVRFKPREGVLSKVLNRISVSLSLKDLLGLGTPRT
jgi:hypothetical protein